MMTTPEMTKNPGECAKRALDEGQGIVRLTPTWVPRSFCIPGRRIKLHPDDYYALGGERGGIDERWFSSTTPADNGPLTSEHEGLSFIVCGDEKVLLRDAVEEMEAEGYSDKWICYKSDAFSAKELTVLPGKTVTIKDGGCYGFIMMQGHGTINGLKIDTPSIIRYGQLTHDEYFVSEKAAQEGVRIENKSDSDPIVMLKHFGPGNPDLNLS